MRHFLRFFTLLLFSSLFAEVSVEVYIPPQQLPKDYIPPCDENFINTIVSFHDYIPPDDTIEILEDRAIVQRYGTCISSQKRGTDELKLVLISQGYLPGEEISITLQNTQGTYKEQFFVTPFPLIGENKNDNTKLVAKLISRNPSVYFIEFYGYDPKEELSFVSISNNENGVFRMTLENKSLVYAPSTLTEKSGLAHYSIVRDSGGITTVHLPWGFQLENNLLGISSLPEIRKFQDN